MSESSGGGYHAVNTVERVVIAGVVKVPNKVLLKKWGADPIELISSFDAVSAVLTIKKPDVLVCDTWTITLT